MHKKQNKHGPDTATGIRMGWPRGPAYITGEPPRWMEIRYGPPSHVPRPTSLVPQMERWRSGTGKRDGPDGFARGPDKVWPPGILKSEKRQRWRPHDFITLRRTGESPPGIVKRLTMNHIDSPARNKLPARGRLKHGVLKDNYGLTATTMPKRMEKKPRKDAETQRYATIGFGVIPRKDAVTHRHAMIDFGFQISDLLSVNSASLRFGLKLPRKDAMRNQRYRPSSHTSLFPFSRREHDMNEHPQVQHTAIFVGAAHREMVNQVQRTAIFVDAAHREMGNQVQRTAIFVDAAHREMVNPVQRTEILVKHDMNEQPQVQRTAIFVDAAHREMVNQVQRTAIFVGAMHRDIGRRRTKTGLKNSRKDAETQRYAMIGFGVIPRKDAVTHRHAMIGFGFQISDLPSVNSASLRFGLKLPRKDAMRNQRYRLSSHTSLVPFSRRATKVQSEPSSLVPFASLVPLRTTMNLLIN